MVIIRFYGPIPPTSVPLAIYSQLLVILLHLTSPAATISSADVHYQKFELCKPGLKCHEGASGPHEHTSQYQQSTAIFIELEDHCFVKLLLSASFCQLPSASNPLLQGLQKTVCSSSEVEGDALIAVKNSFNDPKTLSTWDSNLQTPCTTWIGVNCNNNLRVISVNLAGLGLSGRLSAEIAKLQMLESLTLQGNTISGPLPNELGNLSLLQMLNADNNSFNGSIPSTLGQLVKLQNLILNNNHLSGDIPASITVIPSLLDLDLSYNNLTGQIPDAAFTIKNYNFVGNQLVCGSIDSRPCQSKTSQSSGQTPAKANMSGLIGGLVGAAAFSASLTIGVICYGRNRWRKKDVFVDVPAEDDVKIAFGQLKRFSWRELQVATNSFSEQNVIGQGAFGKVYKGILNDNTEIAVKRSLNSSLEGGETAFLQEVEIISVAAHRNLLHLMGFCVTPSERILVYPYMSNKSIAYCLRERKPGEPGLDWNKRKNIALGAARGLTYLHDHCNPKIIHRDVKAANVMLDRDFEAVVGDFGLAKMLDTRNTHVTTMVRGTMGHIAPEYLSTGKATEKTDVFGYGVMLLELVTGQRAIDISRLQDEDVLLLDHVKTLKHEKRLNSIVDANLSEYDSQEVEELIQVALLCTQANPDDRPSMAEVVQMLVDEGLTERWKEWQQVEVISRQQYDSMPQKLALWVENSTINQDAIELSAPR